MNRAQIFPSSPLKCGCFRDVYQSKDEGVLNFSSAYLVSGECQSAWLFSSILFYLKNVSFGFFILLTNQHAKTSTKNELSGSRITHPPESVHSHVVSLVRLQVLPTVRFGTFVDHSLFRPDQKQVLAVPIEVKAATARQS